MTRTDRCAARLALVERQRRFAWELAHDEYARSAARMVAGKSHDLLNLVQIVQLAAPVLASSVDAEARLLVDDIARAAKDSHAQLEELLARARPAVGRSTSRGAPVGPLVGRIVGELDAAADIGVDYAIDVDAATALDATALAHLLIGLVLDVDPRTWIELTVRDRTINGSRWIEIVRGTSASSEDDREPQTSTDGADATIDRASTHDHFDLRLVEALAMRARGEVARSERRGGGIEVTVAMPVIKGPDPFVTSA